MSLYADKALTAATETVDPIAILGMACRFPGADDLDAFWAIQRDAIDASTEFPSDRWGSDEMTNSFPDDPDLAFVRRGGFVSRLTEFDAGFFGISETEATALDPQHRLLLETGWHAIEDAALKPDSLPRTKCGVFIGISGSEYGQMRMKSLGPMSAYEAMGNAPSVAVNRLSRLLGVTGPSLGVDSGCSSSLVAVHLACQSLQRGESQLALAGGVNALWAPEVSLALAEAWMLSPEGKCKSFDASADGYIRAEGCGVVVLKRLTDAIRDEDPVRAVILGSGVAHCGSDASGYLGLGTAMESACKAAGISTEEIGYIEAHGAGSPRADGNEIDGFARLLEQRHGQPCLVGSIKTNIGNLEAAAGAAALIRTVQLLENECIPPLLHLKNPNAALGRSQGRLELPSRTTPWPRGTARRVAAVNSFGLGGTYAHALVAEGPQRAPADHHQSGGALALSAKTPEALRSLAGCWAEYIAAHPEICWADACFTAKAGRAQLPVSISIGASNTADGVGQLKRFHRTGEVAPFDGGYDSPGKRISLPGYPFEQKPYLPRRKSVNKSPVLSRLASPAFKGFAYETLLQPEMECVAGHRVHGSPVASGPLLASLIAEAAQRNIGDCSLTDLELLTPLRFSTEGRMLHLLFEDDRGDGLRCNVYSRAANEYTKWLLHAECGVVASRNLNSFCQAEAACGPGELLSGEVFYSSCREAGIELAPQMRVSLGFERFASRCSSRLDLTAASLNRTGKIGTALQAAVELLAVVTQPRFEAAWIPVSVEAVQISTTAQLELGHANLIGADDTDILGDAFFTDSAGVPCAEVRGLRLRAAGREAFLNVPLSQDVPVANAPPDPFLIAIEAADRARRTMMLMEWLHVQIRSLLRTEPMTFDENAGFFDLGIDSLMLVELRNRLQRLLHRRIDVSMAALFSYPTAAALAAYICSEVWPEKPDAELDTIEYEVLQLSEEELDRSLKAYE